MVYRKVQPQDVPKIEALLKSHGVDYDLSRIPALGFVAVGDNGDLVGVILAHTCLLVEPFVCENPTAGVKLNYMMEGAMLTLGSAVAVAHVKSENEKLDVEIRRAGYSELNNTDFKIYTKVNPRG